MTPAPSTAARRTRSGGADDTEGAGKRWEARQRTAKTRGPASRAGPRFRGDEGRLERVRALQREDRHRRVVAALQEPERRGAARGLADRRVLRGDVRESRVELEVRVPLVLRAEREPPAVGIRQARRAVRRVDRRLVERDAAAE